MDSKRGSRVKQSAKFGINSGSQLPAHLLAHPEQDRELFVAFQPRTSPPGPKKGVKSPENQALGGVRWS